MSETTLTPKVAPDPRTPANMRVNGGALILALNVLRRAGKNEVADELEKTAAPAAQEDALDTVRLNWLEGVEGRFYNIDRISAVVGTGFLTRTENGTAQISPTLRAAIDAARALEGGADAPR